MLVAGVGSDHHPYATLVKANAIVRITPGVGGAALRMDRMPLPAPVLPAGQSAGSSYNPYAIVPALGGVWFTEEGFNLLGRLGSDGHYGEYYAFAGNNLQNTFPSIIARAPDGTLWLTASDANATNNRIVHLTGSPSEIGNNA